MKLGFKFLKRRSFWTHTAVAVIAVLVFGVVELLPAALGNRFLPALAASFGLHGIDADIRKLGINGAELSRTRLNFDGKRSVSINSVKLEYRLPLWPFERGITVKSAEISGFRINAVEKDGKLVIPGIPEEWLTGQKKKRTASSGAAPMFKIKRVVLRDCLIRIEREDGILEIPFAVRFNMPEESSSPMRLRAEVKFFGDNLEISAWWQRDSGEFETALNGRVRSANYLRLAPQLRGKFSGVGEFSGNLRGVYKPGMKLPEKLDGLLTFQRFRFAAAGVQCGTEPDQPLTLKINGYDFALDGLTLTKPFHAGFEQIAGTAVYENDKVTIPHNLNLRIAAATNPQLKLAQDITLALAGIFDWDAQRKTSSISGRCTSSVLAVAKIRTDDALLTYDGILKDGLPAANFHLTIPSATLVETGLKTGNIRLNGRWPRVADRPEIGKLKIDDVVFRDYRIDGLAWDILFEDGKVLMNGTVDQKILPEVVCTNNLSVSLGSAPVAEAAIKLVLPENTAPFSLHRFNKKLPELLFSGGIELNGLWQWQSGKQQCAAKLMLRNGRLDGEEMEIHAEGIDADIDVSLIPEVGTPPLQHFGCRKFAFKALIFEDIAARFQLEHGKEFLLEEFSSRWCGGNIFTQSLRFNPEVSETKAVIYCNDIKLAELLAQTGIAKAEGGGKLHGKLPLRFGPAGISFDAGFLYSAPGETRNIKLSGLQKKLQDIPPETAQFAQLDLAYEALKDFDYEWIKLDFASSGEYLNINSQFNGRPKNPLPFEFDQKRGGFVRSEQQTARFQGIKLDLNSSFPLNTIVDLNKKFKNLFKRGAQ